MAHGVVMEEWTERDSEKSPGPASSTTSSSGRVMGSRRIFAPQFKLQVLDSYRQDADCKGNQRATARKYGIHRRQIQKWLQMESHLRSLTGGTSSSVGSGAPSSPGGVSTASLSSPVPSPSPVSPSGPSGMQGLLLSEPMLPLGPLGALGSHVAVSALNLSAEARLLGGMAGLAARGSGCSAISMSGASRASPSPPSGSGSPLHSVHSVHSLHSLHATSASPSPRASPAGSPAPHQVPVPRLSVSPTLPIKKRWCQSPDQAAISSPPPLPLAMISDEDDEDDDEDIDVDGDGTDSEASSALDYTTATLSKRRSFSLQFKLEVLDAFREHPRCQGNQRATARAFGINRRQVQKWLGQEPELREEAVSRGGLNRQRLGRWLEQDEALDSGCLDLSRKRKHEPPTPTSDLDDAETEAKRSRVTEVPSVVAPGPRPAPLGGLSGLGDVDAFRPHLPPHPLLFRPQPVSLPLLPHLPLPPLPFNLCAKQYSVDLKLTEVYFNAHQQNLQKWMKQEDFLKHSNSASFLLNSFR